MSVDRPTATPLGGALSMRAHATGPSRISPSGDFAAVLGPAHGSRFDCGLIEAAPPFAPPFAPRPAAMKLGAVVAAHAMAALLTTQAFAAELSPAPAADRMNRYNVVWDTPSRDASGAMPIGNGDIAASVYAIENGDLYLLLSKNDAYTYQGDLFKTGRVRVSLSPNPFTTGKPFRQELDIVTGSIRIEADGVKLHIWVDANRPVYHVQITSPAPLNVSAQPEKWTRFDACIFNSTKLNAPAIIAPPSGVPTQDVHLARDGRLLWYYAVGDRSVFDDDLKYYGAEAMTGKFHDPYRFNTFGNLMESPDLRLADDRTLKGAGQEFDLRVHALALQTPKAETWIESIEKQTAKPADTARDWAAHRDWWQAFWARGWIIANDRTVPAEAQGKLLGEPDGTGMRPEADGSALVSQSYQVFRFLMASQSRGRVPTKFNGGIFTQQLFLSDSNPGDAKFVRPRRSADPQPVAGGKLTHEDDRLWGRRFTYQNQRLLYWPLLASGDFDLMKPFFRYYSDLLPVRRAITQAWFGHDGTYYRENIEPTGAERDCERDGRPLKAPPGTPAEFYHDYYFTSGLETTLMMIDYVRHTGDRRFLDDVLVPFAREILRFYDRHYTRGADGKLRIDPAQVLETWWRAVNPAPDIAGLQVCLDGVLALSAGSSSDQAEWKKLRGELPALPTHTLDGKTAIAPAESWEKSKNFENGELYPVFPFPVHGLAHGTAGMVKTTMEQRRFKDSFECGCWTQDQIDWALAGNAAEAAAGLVRRFRKASKMCRFPLYGREGPDSCPDFDHFGSGSIALQRMLVQEGKGKIFLLPAWPAAWDVDFKLHVSNGGTIHGIVRDGQLTQWNIEPASRRNEVVVCQLQPGNPK